MLWLISTLTRPFDWQDRWWPWMTANGSFSIYSVCVRRRTGQPLLSDTVRIRRLKLFGHVARADKSQDHSRALQACISPAPRNWRRHPGRPRHTWLRTVICANLILALRQGFGELKTEQLGGHSQEQQRHRQAPVDWWARVGGAGYQRCQFH